MGKPDKIYRYLIRFFVLWAIFTGEIIQYITFYFSIVGSDPVDVKMCLLGYLYVKRK